MKSIARLLLIIALPLLAFGQEAVERSYPVSKDTNLSLTVPAAWIDALQVSTKGFPPTVSLTDPDHVTEILVTPIWSPKGEERSNATSKAKEFVQAAALRVLPSATQSSLPIQSLRGKAGAGFYFWAQDRAPQPGEYEYMAQGAVPAGSALLSFTVLMHKEPPSGLEQALDIITSAKLER